MSVPAVHSNRWARDRLLAQLVEALRADPRFVAAWLVGSLGRGQADRVSDVDLFVAVADDHAPSLCARPWHAEAASTEERLALFGRFGRPAWVYENHGNAAEGGSYTFVLYEDGLGIDWFLVPLGGAERPPDSRLLFEQAPIPISDQAWGESFAVARGGSGSERIGYFWLMACVTAKHLVRGEPVDLHIKLDLLDRVADEIERLIAEEPWRSRRSSSLALATTAEEQLAAFRAVCDRVEKVAATAGQPETPRRVIEKLLASDPESGAPEPKVSLRRIEAADREELRQVVQRYWAELMPRSPVVQDAERGRAYFEGRFQLASDALAHWWAMAEGERVGFASVELHEDNEGRWAYISDFYIEPGWRRQGYGGALARALVDRLSEGGFDRIDLYVRRDNPGAFEFWRKMGFELASYKFRRYVEK